jgi:hypothetical protein
MLVVDGSISNKASECKNCGGTNFRHVVFQKVNYAFVGQISDAKPISITINKKSYRITYHLALSYSTHSRPSPIKSH